MGRKALVLSGGGAKGAFQLGVIDYLINDRRMNFEVLAGISTGTLNSVMLSHTPGYDGLKSSLENLKSIWLKEVRGNSDIYKKRFLGILGIALGADSLYDFTPLSKLMDKHLDINALQASDRVLLFGVVELCSGKYFVIKKDSSGLKKIDPKSKEVEPLSWELFKKYVLASATIPFAFPPLKDNRKLLVDGGARNITPVADAFDALKELGNGQQDDEIYVVLASPMEISEIPAGKGKLDDGIKIAKRAVGILENEVYENDLRIAEDINEAIKAELDLKKAIIEKLGSDRAESIFKKIKFPFADKKYAKLTTIEPEKEYTGTLEFDPAKIKQAFDAGREAARKKLGGV